VVRVVARLALLVVAVDRADQLQPAAARARPRRAGALREGGTAPTSTCARTRSTAARTTRRSTSTRRATSATSRT
jgi:hypothetical protein